MALSKFLVLLAIFLSASLGDAFVNQARLNHLIRFDASKSNPTIKPSRVPSRKPTSDQMNDQTTNRRLEWNAELSNVLSSKRVKYSLSSRQDANLSSKTTVTQNTQSRGLCHGEKSEPGLLKQPVQYEREIIRSSPAVDAFSQQALHSFQYANINHKRQFTGSARVPSSTICSFQYGLSSTLVQSLLVKVSESSTKKVSSHAFGFASLAFEPVTSTNSSAKAAPDMQAFAVKNKSNNALPFGSKSNKSFDYASLFGDKPSSKHWLVVAFVRNEDFIGQTIDSPAGCIASAQIQTSPNQLHELIELIMAFRHNYMEIIKLKNLIVASVIWLPNAKSARVKHSSSSKSSNTSGFNCQFIVESDFEGAQAYNVSPDSISHRYHCHRSSPLSPLSSSSRSKTFSLNLSEMITFSGYEICYSTGSMDISS